MAKSERTRDVQRKRLYQAENRAGAGLGERMDLPEAVDYVRKTLSRAPIRRRYGAVYAKWPILVGDGRGMRSAQGDYRGVDLPRWSRTPLVILHEVAHAITDRYYGADLGGHGPEFASVLLDLVRFGVGKDAYERMKREFQAGAVRFAPKRGCLFAPRPMSAWGLPVCNKIAVLKPPPTREASVSDQDKVAYRGLRKLARLHGFTYKTSEDSYIETSPFGPFAKGFNTYHYGWTETLYRLELCLADPTLVDADGYYGE